MALVNLPPMEMVIENNSSLDTLNQTVGPNCPGSVTTFSVTGFLVLSGLTCFFLGFSCRKAPRNFLITQDREGQTQVERFLGTRRPLTLDLAQFMLLIIWILYTFREFRFFEGMDQFMEGFGIFVLYDIGVFVHLCIQFKRSRLSRRSFIRRMDKYMKRMLSFCIYSLFIGFPIGTLSKILFMLWITKHVSSWTIPLPYLLALGVGGIFLPSMAFYQIIHIYYTATVMTRQRKCRITVIALSTICIWAWFYGFVRFETFISQADMPLRTCWTLETLTVLIIPIVALFTICVYPAYTGKGEIIWYQPEILFCWCIAGVSIPTMIWLQDDKEESKTLWYAFAPLFLSAVVQLMFFLMRMSNPIWSHGQGISATDGPVVRPSLTVRRRRVVKALRGTNVIKLDTNWVLRRQRVLRDKESLPQPPNIETEKCSICLEPFSVDLDDVNIGYLRKCGHIYHFDCVWRWIDDNKKCPLCREGVDITEDDMVLLSLSELRDLFQNDNKKMSKDTKSVKSHKSVKSGKSSAGVSNKGHLRTASTSTRVSNPAYEINENPMPGSSCESEITNMDQHINQIFSIVLPESYQENVSTMEGFPYLNSTCTLCMEPYDPHLRDIEVGYLLPCMHFFHIDCISSWINQYNVCPHCPLGRRLLDEDDINMMALDDLLEDIEDEEPWKYTD